MVLRVNLILAAVALMGVAGATGRSQAALISEDFSTNPIPGGRFSQSTAGTESSYSYNAGNQNLTAVLDVDNAAAGYRSTPALSPGLTDLTSSSFQFDFRIDAIDDQASPAAYVGLTAAQHVNDFGDGLTVSFSLAGGIPQARARIDEGGFKSTGVAAVPLEIATDYRALGSYSDLNRRFTIAIFSGPDFATFLGASFADLPVGKNLLVNRFDIQNSGRIVTDQAVGSMTFTIDNISVVPEPASWLLLACGAVLVSVKAIRRRNWARGSGALCRPIAIAILGLLLARSPCIAADAVAPVYHLTDLGDFAGGTNLSFAHSINDLGQVVGYSSSTDGNRAFLWTRDSGMVSLGVLSGHTDSSAAAINNHGQVVGSSGRGGTPSDYRAFIWDSAAEMRSLPDLPNSYPFASAAGINDSGQVAGDSHDNHFEMRAFLGNEDGVTNIGTLGGSEAGAFAINETGHVVGQARTPAWPTVHGFIWTPEDGMRDLGTLPGQMYSYGAAINKFDQVAGWGMPDGPGAERAFIWTAESGIVDLGAPAGMDGSRANGINDSGLVVGDAYNVTFGFPSAFLWSTELGMLRLNDLVDASGSGSSLAFAKDINNRGQIVGAGYSPSFSSNLHAFLLSPVIAGDANFDTYVDGIDYTAWADHFYLNVAGGAPQGDFNDDGFIDGADYIVWADHFDPQILPSLSVVPEPSTALLMLLGTAILLLNRRRTKASRQLTSHT